jgi:hypothetical protein
MVHLLSQLDPMVWLMMVVVAIAFAVSAVVLVELLPGNREELPPLPLDADAAPGVAQSTAVAEPEPPQVSLDQTRNGVTHV